MFELNINQNVKQTENSTLMTAVTRKSRGFRRG